MEKKDYLQEDLINLCNCAELCWTDFQDCTFLITGATGMIGCFVIKTLLQANRIYHLNIKILALVRDLSKAEKHFSGQPITYLVQDICSPIKVSEKIDFVIHCAAITTSKVMLENPIKVIETLVHGTHNLLAEVCRHDIKSMVYLSSMEVYGSFKQALKQVDEQSLGAIDLFNPRSCYPEGKRMCECLCNCYFYQHNIPVKIARLAQVFGAGTEADDPRVFAQFARSSLRGEDIVLHTDGSSIGNYCYTADAIKAIFMILQKGAHGETYNVSNEGNTMTIKQMAELVCKEIAAGAVQVRMQISSNPNALGYAPQTSVILNSEKLRKLGWKPSYSLTDMYRRMVKSWDDYGTI